MIGIQTISFWLRYGGWGAVIMAVVILIGPQFTPVPEKAGLIAVEGRVVDVTYERKDLKSTLEPASRLHVQDAAGHVHQVRVQSWRLPYARLQELTGRRIHALYGGFFDNGWAYELIVEGTTMIAYEVAAKERAAVLARLPSFAPGFALFGLVFLGVHRLLFGSFTSWPGPPGPPIPLIDQRAVRTGFGRR